MKKIIVLFVFLAGCASSGYNPNNASAGVQAQMRNHNPDTLNCPVGAVAACDVEGGALIGKTHSNCRCIDD